MKLPATDRATLTDTQMRDYSEALANIDAVLKLARANFPNNTDVRIETSGDAPKAMLTVRWYALAFFLDAGRAALSLAGDKP